MMKKNNKGFSLIELIVTLAIMAIVTGVSISIYQYVSTSKVKAASSGINDQLTNTRTNTMSKKGNWSMKVICENERYYAVVYCNGHEYDKTDLGRSDSYTLTYSKTLTDASGSGIETTGNTITDDSSTWPVILFNSGSGACMKYNGYYVNEFNISNAKLTQVVKIAKTTGKHYIE